jgi:hypothetical protein
LHGISIHRRRYTDDYNLSLSQEIEPVSLTECGGYVHRGDAGQLPACGMGYGFRNLNVLAATLAAYRDARRPASTAMGNAAIQTRLSVFH